MAASTIIGLMDDLSLASDFPPASEADWRVIVDKALAGGAFDVLRTPLYEGFSAEPLYTKQQGALPVHCVRGWRVIQPLIGTLAADAHVQLADDVQGGADAFSLDFNSGLGIQTVEGLKPLVSPGISYHVASGAPVADAALILAAVQNNNGPAEIVGSAGFDPLTAFAATGERPADCEALIADHADAAFYLSDQAPSFVPFVASGHVWHGAGGSAVQELAFALSAGTAYWRALAGGGMPVADAARCIGFSLTAASDIFLTIATFRAMRLLWGAALAAAGVKAEPDMPLLAQVSRRDLSTYDPHVNILRGTAAAFGAAIGGATGIEVIPFDDEAGATHFSRRLARNTSLILQQESQLSAVADAAAGSAYVETLTRELASAAWTLFREVEAMGGLAAALESGFVQAKLQQTANKREVAIAKRKDKITGVSVFPNLSEKPASSKRVAGGKSIHPYALGPALPSPGKGERFAALVAAARAGAALQDLRFACKRVSDIAAPALPALKRNAEPFEALRQRADMALASIGSRPPIFLAVLGKPDNYRARANWVQGFFATGGIEIIVPEPGFDSVEALASVFKQSPAPVACLCSSNDVYAAMAGAALALKQAGAVFVYLAGPASVLKNLAPQDASAIDRLVYEGCHAVALLNEAQSILKVEELSEAANREAQEEGFDIYGDASDRAY
jgi:methylmalonyl-CoA mutase